MPQVGVRRRSEAALSPLSLPDGTMGRSFGPPGELVRHICGPQVCRPFRIVQTAPCLCSTLFAMPVLAVETATRGQPELLARVTWRITVGGSCTLDAPLRAQRICVCWCLLFQCSVSSPRAGSIDLRCSKNDRVILWKVSHSLAWGRVAFSFSPAPTQRGRSQGKGGLRRVQNPTHQCVCPVAISKPPHPPLSLHPL